MKIGIDIRLIGKKQTGSEAVFFNLVKNLALVDKINQYVLFTDILDSGKIRKIGENLGIIDKNNFKIITLGTTNKFVWNFWTLPSYLMKNPLDIYLTQYITPFFVPKKIKIITIIHDVSFKAYGQFIKFWDLFFLNLLIPRSLKRADKIIAVSKFTRDEIIKYYGVNPEKVEFIYNAVSDDFLAQDSSGEKVKTVRKKYNLPEKYILYIGTLQPRKNIPALIEAFAKIKNSSSGHTYRLPGELKDIKLVIAGGRGHNFDFKIDEEIKKHSLEGEVIFPGFINEQDKAALMKGAAIFCYPSHYEGFGIPILEAMSVQTPVLASSIAPHLEVAGNAAIFFDPVNAVELAEKIAQLLNSSNIRTDLIEEGSLRVKNFSWKKTADKMIEIFSSQMLN